MKKLIYGIAINDADYMVTKSPDGKRDNCPYYIVWIAMLCRCYSKKHLKKYPNYTGCSVVAEWHLFSNFKNWMEAQDWRGKQLDKDIMYPGNRVYSPDTCVFVTHRINDLIIYRRSNQGKFPVGVKKDRGRFSARLNINGYQSFLGSFGTPEEADNVYREAKRLHILRTACCEPDVRVKQGLYRHSELFR